MARQPKYTDKELLHMLRDQANGVYAPLQKDVKEWRTIVRRFGSWEQAVEKAGLFLNPRTRTWKRLPLHEMLELVRQIAKQRREYPKKSHVPCSNALIKVFGSWDNVLKGAGVHELNLNWRYDEGMFFDETF